MIQLIEQNVYFGPNKEIDRRAIALVLHIPSVDIEQCVSSAAQSRFSQSLQEILPSPLLFDREERLPDLIVSLASQLQCATGQQMWLGETNQLQRPDHYRILYDYDDPELGLKAGLLAIQLVQFLIGQEQKSEKIDLMLALTEYVQFALKRVTPIDTQALTIAATELNLPLLRLDQWPFVKEGTDLSEEQLGLVQIGRGKCRKLFRGSKKGLVVENMKVELFDPAYCAAQMHANGLPIPLQDPEKHRENNLKRAKHSADRIGYPVVLKARGGSYKVPTITGIKNHDELTAAYNRIRPITNRVFVEKEVVGETYRILVLQGGVIAVCRKHTKLNVDLSEKLHFELADIAITVAEIFKFDLAGVDIVTTDISQSLATVGGALVGVTSCPELSLHSTQSETFPLTISTKILEGFFPSKQSGHIPIASITGTNGKTTSCRMVARILRAAGYITGLACTDGIYINGELKTKGTFSGIAGAVTLFRNPKIESAVLETSRGTLLEHGLAFDSCQVSACTNVAAEHLGSGGIETKEEMAALKQLVIERAKKVVVLNADDPLCLGMIPYIRLQSIFLVSTNSGNPVILQHLDSGGTAVLLSPDKELIVLHEGQSSTSLLRVDEIPATWSGKAMFNIENALIASAVALGMGVGVPAIQSGLRGFEATFVETQGRLNIFDKHDFDVIFDFSHNAHGLEALCSCIDQIPVIGRRIVVFSAVANRNEIDILNNAKAVAGHFDHYICANFIKLHDQDPQKVPDLLKRGLREQKISDDAISLIYLPPVTAIDTILNMAEKNDLVTILIGKREEYWEQIIKFSPRTR